MNGLKSEKKPPMSLRTDAYLAMVGKEVGVSSWHLIDRAAHQRSMPT